MPITISGLPASSTNFQGSVIANYIVSRLTRRPQFFGNPARFVNKVTIPPGVGDTVRFPYYVPLPVPFGQLPDLTIPDPLTVSSNSTDIVLKYWGAATRVSMREAYRLRHDVFKVILDLMADAFFRHCYGLIYRAMLNNGTKSYASTATSRGALTSAMVANSTEIANIVKTLRNIGAPPNGIGKASNFICFFNPNTELQLQNDATYTGATNFQTKELYTGLVASWKGCDFITANFLPTYKLLGAVTAAGASVTGGGLTASTNYFLVVTTVNPLTGFEEDIAAEATVNTGVGNNAINVTLPVGASLDVESNISKQFNIYLGSVSGQAKLYNVDATANNPVPYNGNQVISVTAVGTGPNAPPAPASGVSVSPLIFLPADAVAITTTEKNPFGRFRSFKSEPGNITIMGGEMPVAKSLGWLLDDAEVVLKPTWVRILEVGG